MFELALAVTTLLWALIGSFVGGAILLRNSRVQGYKRGDEVGVGEAALQVFLEVTVLGALKQVLFDDLPLEIRRSQIIQRNSGIMIGAVCGLVGAPVVCAIFPQVAFHCAVVALIPVAIISFVALGKAVFAVAPGFLPLVHWLSGIGGAHFKFSLLADEFPTPADETTSVDLAAEPAVADQIADPLVDPAVPQTASCDVEAALEPKPLREMLSISASLARGLFDPNAKWLSIVRTTR